MGELRFSIPDEIHKELKKMAIEEGSSLKQLINDILQLYIEVLQKQKGQPDKEVR